MNQMKRIKSLFILSLVGICFSCESFMEPSLDQYKSPEMILKSKDDFMGVMYSAYTGLPNRISFAYEAATDNAVANSENNVSSRAARGGISLMSNPLGDTWTRSYMYINRVNWYIEQMVLDYSKPIPTPVKFDIDPVVNMQYFNFTLGEAYFMRAWYQFDLLQKYGGVGEDGKAYGFPISTSFLDVNDELDLPRNTYQECVDQIATDCDSAYKYLPLNYTKAQGLLSEGCVNEAGHASGVAAAALKARAYLYAASPAYNVENDNTKWEKAAKAASFAINAAEYVDLRSFSDYFSKAKLNDKAYNNPDILFRGAIRQNVTVYESENYPPRAGSGSGLFNPSQNLVDAFPMSDGYPITASSTEKPYKPGEMFAERDLRLNLFIVRTGENFANITIDTQVGGADAFGADVNATRSGYYLQKLLDGSVRLTTGAVVTTTFAPILLGRPELYLNFVEAAIQATGNPDDRSYGYSAREVLAKIRDRAFGANKDAYLPKVTGKMAFAELVKNERRIELCFEDHRFWDLRRWSTKQSDLNLVNVPVYGIYSENALETRDFRSPYMPLPYNEILKTNNLVNNAGWN